MGMEQISANKLSFGISKKNVLFLSILAASAILAIAVFAVSPPWTNNGADVRLVTNNSINYVNQSSTEKIVNFTIQWFSVINTTQASQASNMSAFNLSTIKDGVNSTLNFTRIVNASDANVSSPAAGSSSCARANSTNGSWIYCTNFTQNLTNGSVLSLNVGIIGNVEGLYVIVLQNATSNGTVGTGSNDAGNWSNATINSVYGTLNGFFLADFTNPNLTAVATNVTGGSATTGNGTANVSQLVNITFRVNDTYLNFSTLGAGARPLKIFLYDAGSNVTTRFVVNGSEPSAFGTVINETVSTKAGGDIWNFTLNFTLNGSMCEWGKAVAGVCANVTTGGFPGAGGVHFNATAYISLIDNASHSVTRYWSGWVFLDNRTPVINSTNTTGNPTYNNSNTVDPDDTVVITWSEPMNASIGNYSHYDVSITAGRRVNFTLVVQNKSDTTTVTLSIPGMNYSTNYTVSVIGNASGAPTDLAGNLFNFKNGSYNFSFLVVDQAASTGQSGSVASGGGGAAAAVVQNIVSEDKPSATVSFNVGESATFSVPSSTSDGGVASESHSLKVDSIVGGIVTVTITSDPLKLQLPINVPVYVDVNGDGSNDIIVTVLEILSQTAARIKIDYIAKPVAKKAAPAVTAPTPEVTAPTPPAVPEVTTPEVAEEAAEQAPMNTMLLVVVVVIIVLVGLGYWYTQKKGQASF